MDTRGAASGWRSFLLAALAVGVLLGGTLAAFTPSFQQNDDVVMAMIASGRGIALEPDAHLVYVNGLLGEPLRQAYRRAPAWPWYGLLLVGAVAAVQVALLHARLAGGVPAPARLLVFLACFAAVASVFVVRLQFTAVAGLAAGAGLALGIARLAPEDGEPGVGRPALGALVSASLLLLGGLLRFQALLLALAVASPFALERLGRVGLRRALRAAGALAAVLALAAALHLWDRSWYGRDPGWREFGELNAWRARIVDYGAGGDGGEARALERRLGWSANDVLMLRRWFYADRAVYPIEKMRDLVGAFPVIRPGLAETWARVREAFSHASFLPLVLVLPLLVVCGEVRERLRMLGLALVPALLVVALLAVFLRAPEHVGLPALAFAPTALLATAGDRPRGGRFALLLAVAAAGAGASLAAWQCRADSLAAREDNRDLRRSVATLTARPQRLYVEWAGAFRYEAVLPLEDSSYLAGLRLYSLGWPQRSPIADRMLGATGVGDLVRGLFERPDLGLLMNPAWSDSLEQYAREHYGTGLRIREGVRTPSFTVFRVERAEAAPAGASAH